MPDFRIERRCRGLVCGVDEAGRGPLAGPVVAAAVVLDPRRFPKMLRDAARRFESAEHRRTGDLLPRASGAAPIAGQPASASARRASPKSIASTSCARRCWRWPGRWQCSEFAPISRSSTARCSAADLRGANRRQRRCAQLLDRRRFRRRQGHARPDHARSCAALSGLWLGDQCRLCDAGAWRGDSPIRASPAIIAAPSRRSASQLAGEDLLPLLPNSSRDPRRLQHYRDRRERRDRVPRDLLHQGRQCMLAEPVDPAPEPLRVAHPGQYREFEAEMSEAVADGAGKAATRRPSPAQPDRLGEASTVRHATASRGSRSCRRADPSPGGGAAAPRRPAGSARTRHRGAVGRSGFSAAHGNASARPDAAAAQQDAPWAEDAARPARGADRCAEIHQGLSEVAGPSVRDQRCGKRLGGASLPPATVLAPRRGER